MQKLSLCGRIIRIWSPFVVWMSCRRVVPPTDPKLAVQCSVDLLVDFTLLNNDFFQCIVWVYFPIWCRTTNYQLYPLYHPLPTGGMWNTAAPLFSAMCRLQECLNNIFKMLVNAHNERAQLSRAKRWGGYCIVHCANQIWVQLFC